MKQVTIDRLNGNIEAAIRRLPDGVWQPKTLKITCLVDGQDMRIEVFPKVVAKSTEAQLVLQGMRYGNSYIFAEKQLDSIDSQKSNAYEIIFAPHVTEIIREAAVTLRAMLDGDKEKHPGKQWTRDLPTLEGHSRANERLIYAGAKVSGDI